MRAVILILLFVGYQATVIPEKYIKYLKNIRQLAEDYRKTCLGQMYYEEDGSDDSEADWKPWELEYLENLALNLITNGDEDSNEFDANSKYFESEENTKEIHETTTEDTKEDDEGKKTEVREDSDEDDDDDDIRNTEKLDSEEDRDESGSSNEKTGINKDENGKKSIVKKSEVKAEKKSKISKESEEEDDDSNESS